MPSVTTRIYEKLPVFGQSAVISLYGLRILRERYGREFGKLREFLAMSQHFSDEEMREYQSDRLKSIVEHAYHNVPFYRDAFDRQHLKPRDIVDVDDICKLPIIRKDDIKANFGRMISKGFGSRDLSHGHTSGTTGSPLNVVWDHNVVVANNAVLWRQRNWAGLKFGDRFATFFGRVVAPIRQKRPPYWRYNLAHRQMLFSSFHMSKTTLPHYFEALRSFEPECIEGYPSNMFLLARYLEASNERFPVKAILTTSETLHGYQRELIEDRFQCRIFDYYGMAERVVFATECERHAGHHLNSEYGITEILLPDGTPAGAGQMGRVVATSLQNYGMPFLRYETSDVSALKQEKCACGRVLPLLEDVTTKAEDVVSTADGRFISPSALTHPFKPISSIAESQIVQESINLLVIRVVRKDGYSEEDSRRLVTAMRERVGEGMKIELVFTEKIPRGGNGKFRWVISKVPLKL